MRNIRYRINETSLLISMRFKLYYLDFFISRNFSRVAARTGAAIPFLISLVGGASGWKEKSLNKEDTYE